MFGCLMVIMGPRRCRREHKQCLKFLESPSRTIIALNSPVPFMNPAPVRVADIDKTSKWISPQFKCNGKFGLKPSGARIRNRNKRDSSLHPFPALPFSSHGESLCKRRTLSLDSVLNSDEENEVKNSSGNSKKRAFSDGEIKNCQGSDEHRRYSAENEELGAGLPDNECSNSASNANNEISILNNVCLDNNQSQHHSLPNINKHLTKIQPSTPELFFLANFFRDKSPEKVKPKILVEDTPVHAYGLSVRKRQLLEASETYPNKKLFLEIFN